MIPITSGGTKTRNPQAAASETPRQISTSVSTFFAPLASSGSKAWARSGRSPLAEATPDVPEAGVEPARPCGQRILSPPRLPFRHSG